jgi:hypothetical protein
MDAEEEKKANQLINKLREHLAEADLFTLELMLALSTERIANLKGIEHAIQQLCSLIATSILAGTTLDQDLDELKMTLIRMAASIHQEVERGAPLKRSNPDQFFVTLH